MNMTIQKQPVVAQIQQAATQIVSIKNQVQDHKISATEAKSLLQPILDTCSKSIQEKNIVFTKQIDSALKDLLEALNLIRPAVVVNDKSTDVKVGSLIVSLMAFMGQLKASENVDGKKMKLSTKIEGTNKSKEY
ncbi:MAG: hypothetical protein H0W88_01980 [Parachlamydiaceae bacterium]|nr:hypothetical protein [Parachlamydiaceae bacterium]